MFRITSLPDPLTVQTSSTWTNQPQLVTLVCFLVGPFCSPCWHVGGWGWSDVLFSVVAVTNQTIISSYHILAIAVYYTSLRCGVVYCNSLISHV